MSAIAFDSPLLSTGKIGFIPLLEPVIHPRVPSLRARTHTLTSDTKAPESIAALIP